MGQQLRIEGEEAVALAAELAALTGEGVDAAVLLPLLPPFPNSNHDWPCDDVGLRL